MTPHLAVDLQRDEGLKLKPYRDTVGKLTIGVGRNLDDVGISQEEAMYLLAGDIAAAAKALDSKLPWWRTLNDARQDVLVNMAFNLGIDGLLGFVNTLALIKAGEYLSASKNMLNSKWASQVHDRARRLADQMRTGEGA